MSVFNGFYNFFRGEREFLMNERAFDCFADDAFQIRAAVAVGLVGKSIQVDST